MEGTGRSVSTEPERPTLKTVRRARLYRRFLLLALIVFLALGALNVFGVRSATAEAEGGGFELSVTYAAVTRPGLATPFSIEVRREGGFDGPVTIAVSAAYLDMFDENGLDPDPITSRATPDEVIWEFEPPPGDTLGVSYDARTEPAVQSGRDGFVKVIVEGVPVVEVSFRTKVMP